MDKSVLVVDEDINMRELYKAELQPEGYRVLTAADTKEALDYINRDTFDAIIFEPEISNGLELGFLDDFIQVNRKLKVVINSEHPEYKMDFKTWLADAFLTKSSDLSVLKSTVGQLVHDEKNLKENQL